MRLSVDSSSLAKRYVQEDGSEEMDSLLHHASELALCIILLPEIISALNRLQRERVLTVTDYRKAKRQLLDDIHDECIASNGCYTCCLCFGVAGRSICHL